MPSCCLNLYRPYAGLLCDPPPPPPPFLMCLVAVQLRLLVEPTDYATAKPVLQKIAQRVRSCWVEEEECEMVALVAQDANM